MGVRLESKSLDDVEQRFQEFVQDYSLRLHDPVDRLRFVRLYAANVGRYPRWLRRSPLWRLIAHALAFDCLMQLRPDFYAGVGRPTRIALGSFRIGQTVFDATFPKRWAVAALGTPLIVLATAANVGDWMTPLPAPTLATRVSVVNDPVWHVETEGNTELYSNGLRISNEHLTKGESVAMPVLPSGRGLNLISDAGRPEWRDGPMGIVYHTTVSDVIPSFEEENNDLMREKGSALLRYISRKQLYNFVIDRFGRAFRIVHESETAFHAGLSVWGLDNERYIDINDGFIGVAFETRPEAVEIDVERELTITPAQISTARLLTQVLRKAYNIPAGNCVTHEMVAVTPSDMLIGRHTDWAGRFPFEQVGLPDNYQLPLHSVADWGFSYDELLVQTLGGEVWAGVRESEKLFTVEAASRGMSEDAFRRERAKVFRKTREALKRARERRKQRAGEPIS